MTLVNSREILGDARRRKYGIPSLLAGNLEMVLGFVTAAEARRSPLILAFNQEVTPDVPLEIGLAVAVKAARRATVPVATILDHGRSLEDVVKAIQAGSSSVMFDGSDLSYEENVRQTGEVVRVAHATGVCVEAELGGIAGSSIKLGDVGPESLMTDPDQAADFVRRTGVDVLAVSFGNAHGVYKGEPQLDLDRVRQIHQRIDIPLAMHGASGLVESDYPAIVAGGISKVCYYTAMALAAGRDLRRMVAETDEFGMVYHNVISRSLSFFHQDAIRLMDIVGCSGTVT